MTVIAKEELTSHTRSVGSYPAYKDSGVEWLGEIPIHWHVQRLKYAAPPRDERSTAVASDLPYVGLEHIQSGRGRLADGLKMMDSASGGDSSASSLFRVGDVLFGKLRPYLAKALKVEFDGRCSSELVVFRSAGKIIPDFLAYQLLSRGFVRWIDGMTYGAKMPRANPEQVANVSVALPPLREQQFITAFLDRQTAKIESLVTKKERLIELLLEKRTALITDAIAKGLDSKGPMKVSGVEWLGEIPANWEVKRLWHLTPPGRAIMYGIVLPGPNVDDGVPIVKGGDVAADRLQVNKLNKTTFEIESGHVRSRLRRGDLVYAIRGSIGEVAMVPDELEGANLTQDAARIAYTSGTSGDWLLSALRSAVVFAQLEAGALGATIKGVNIRDLKRASIPVPPLCEQERIAEFLNGETARIDSLVGKVREAIARLNELRSALISAAVTGKIDVRHPSGS